MLLVCHVLKEEQRGTKSTLVFSSKLTVCIPSIIIVATKLETELDKMHNQRVFAHYLGYLKEDRVSPPSSIL
jgi:hypothetical protein